MEARPLWTTSSNWLDEKINSGEGGRVALLGPWPRSAVTWIVGCAVVMLQPVHERERVIASRCECIHCQQHPIVQCQPGGHLHHSCLRSSWAVALCDVGSSAVHRARLCRGLLQSLHAILWNRRSLGLVS